MGTAPLQSGAKPIFNRAANLYLMNATTALDLSQLEFQFKVTQNDVETPNIATIRVYNASDQTVNQAIKEYGTVQLQAGYKNGNFGLIFKGTIKQFKKGKERNVDSYLDILAADGDVAYNFGFINQSFPAGTTPEQEMNAYASAMGIPVDPNATVALTGGVILSPRGKAACGLARVYMRDLANSNNARWSIQNGTLTLIPLTGYLPSQVVQINSATGMVGTPEATDQGIKLRCFLNPLIKIGTRIQLNNKDINQTIIKDQFFPSYTSGPTLVANTSNDGIYRVLVAEHSGDIRSQEWYTDIVCLNVDQSASPSDSVPAFPS